MHDDPSPDLDDEPDCAWLDDLLTILLAWVLASLAIGTLVLLGSWLLL